MKKLLAILLTLWLVVPGSMAYADTMVIGGSANLTSPGPIGGTTPSTGSFTSITASSLAAFTTAAESWIGPSSTTGIYFKGGNVGIGTTGPTGSLNIYGNTGAKPQIAYFTDNGSDDPQIRVANGTYTRPTYGFIGSIGTGIYYVSPNGIGFTTNMSLSAVITGDGRFGIGTAAPATGNKLEVNGFAASFTGILTQAATANLAASDMMGQSHIVTGAYVLSLPTAVVGYNSCFMATTAAVFSLDMVTGTDAFYLNQSLLTAGNKVTSDASIRAEICVECKIAGFYETYIRKGIWIDGGA